MTMKPIRTISMRKTPVAKQNPKEPLWLVVYQTLNSRVPSAILGSDGKPMDVMQDHGPEDEMTVHAADENAARAYIEQQNPGIKIVSVEKAQ